MLGCSGYTIAIGHVMAMAIIGVRSGRAEIR